MSTENVSSIITREHVYGSDSLAKLYARPMIMGLVAWRVHFHFYAADGILAETLTARMERHAHG